MLFWWSAWSSCWFFLRWCLVIVLIFNLVLTCLIYLCKPSKNILIGILLKWLCSYLCPCILLLRYFWLITVYKSPTFFNIVVLYSRWQSLLLFWILLFLVRISRIGFRRRRASFIKCFRIWLWRSFKYFPDHWPSAPCYIIKFFMTSWNM